MRYSLCTNSSNAEWLRTLRQSPASTFGKFFTEPKHVRQTTAQESRSHIIAKERKTLSDVAMRNHVFIFVQVKRYVARDILLVYSCIQEASILFVHYEKSIQKVKSPTKLQRYTNTCYGISNSCHYTFIRYLSLNQGLTQLHENHDVAINGT